MPLWVVTLSCAIIAFIYDFRNRPEDNVQQLNVTPSSIDKAEKILDRRRADYNDAGSNLSTLLGFVGAGTGIIAITSPAATLPLTPLLLYAGVSLLIVLALSLAGLRGQHYSDADWPKTQIYEQFMEWLPPTPQSGTDCTTFDRRYTQFVLRTCDRYERARRIRRTYYIYAGWCFALAILAVGLNAAFPACKFQYTDRSLLRDRSVPPCASPSPALK